MYSCERQLTLVESDPLPFLFLGKHKDLCENCVFIDVDYDPLIRRKIKIIEENAPLLELIPDMKAGASDDIQAARSEKYRAFGCDLRQLKALDATLRREFDIDGCSVAILFVAEVSVAYMDRPSADEVIRWATSLPSGTSARFLLAITA